MHYKIAVFEGDGVGPEVIKEGIKVVDKAAELEKFRLEWIKYPHNAELYLEKKKLPNEKILDGIRRSCNAIYLGPIGDSRVEKGVLEKGIFSAIKSFFEQRINLRPVRLLEGVNCPVPHKQKIDFAIIKENSEEFNIGIGGVAKRGKNSLKHNYSDNLYKLKLNLNLNVTNSDIAYQLGVISRRASENVIRYAFEYAKSKNRKKLISVDKPNFSESSEFWREIVRDIARHYHEIDYGFQGLNAATMLLLNSPEVYDVIVSANTTGDMLANLGVFLQGGFGFACSANINPRGISMFHPVHGTAPKFAGKNIVNPIAAIRAGSLMLESIGQPKASQLIDNALEAVLKEGKFRTRDLGGLNSTSEMGDVIVDKIIDLY